MDDSRIFLTSISVSLLVALLISLSLISIGMAMGWALVLGINVAAFLLYGWDKVAAQQGLMRIPEVSLLIIAALGATPGAWIAQELLRHKTSKASFRGMFFAILAVHFGALILYLLLPDK